MQFRQATMRFLSLRSLRSSFSAESRHKSNNKKNNIEIVEWDVEGGFNISLQSDELFGSLKKSESGISKFRRIVSLGRSGSKASVQQDTEYPRVGSQESISLTHHLYEFPSNGSERDEVARLVLSRLVSQDDGIVELAQKYGSNNDSDVIRDGMRQDRYDVPLCSKNTDGDSVTLNTLNHRKHSFDDTVFDGIVDDVAMDVANHDQLTPSTQKRVHRRVSECDREVFIAKQCWPKIDLTCFMMPTVKASSPYTPVSGSVAWDGTVVLSALSY